MKREILFKGKSVKSNEWVHGNLVRYMGNQDEFTDAIQVLDDEKKVKCVVNVIPETIGQFTGLIDKNGVKIFDGDILHRHLGVKWIVIFKKSTWIADGNDSGMYLTANQFSEAEVIGNIHDKK